MTEADPKLLKLVRQVDAERQARLRAERTASVLRAMNTKLRRELRAVTTQDQTPSPSANHIR
jgi:hypothetical protein